MDEEPLVELILLLLAGIFFGARWIYRQVSGLASRRHPQTPTRNVASPTTTFAQPTGRSLPPVAVPAALGSFFGVLLGSLAFAIWVSSQVSLPGNVARAAAFFPAWFCIGAPLISAFSAVAVTIVDNAFREFQARRLPRGLPFVLAALIGLAFSLVSAGVSLTIPCAPFDLC
jgi:hypothetical protein